MLEYKYRRERCSKSFERLSQFNGGRCAKVRNVHPLEEYPISVFRQRVTFSSRVFLFSRLLFSVTFLSFLFLFLPSLPLMLSFSFHVFLYIWMYMDRERRVQAVRRTRRRYILVSTTSDRQTWST